MVQVGASINICQAFSIIFQYVEKNALWFQSWSFNTSQAFSISFYSALTGKSLADLKVKRDGGIWIWLISHSIGFPSNKRTQFLKNSTNRPGPIFRRLKLIRKFSVGEESENEHRVNEAALNQIKLLARNCLSPKKIRKGKRSFHPFHVYSPRHDHQYEWKWKEAQCKKCDEWFVALLPPRTIVCGPIAAQNSTHCWNQAMAMYCVCVWPKSDHCWKQTTLLWCTEWFQGKMRPLFELFN